MDELPECDAGGGKKKRGHNLFKAEDLALPAEPKDQFFNFCWVSCLCFIMKLSYSADTSNSGGFLESLCVVEVINVSRYARI